MSMEGIVHCRDWLEECLDGPPVEVAELSAGMISWLAGFRGDSDLYKNEIRIFLPGEKHLSTGHYLKSYHIASPDGFLEVRPHVPGGRLPRTIIGAAERLSDEGDISYVVLNGNGKWNAFNKNISRSFWPEREPGAFGSIRGFSELDNYDSARLLFYAVAGLIDEVQYARSRYEGEIDC